MRRFDKRRKRPIQFLFVLAAIGTFAMVEVTWETFVERPATYEALRHRACSRTRASAARTT